MRERKIDTLVVRWYERQEKSPGIVPRWLAAAGEHLPEAMPRRFGATEPLRGRLDRDGEAGFREQHAAADQLFFLAGTPPVHHGALATTRSRIYGPTAVHSLHAELEPDDERVRRFALALTHPAMAYVSASVAGGEVLDGGTLYGPAERPAEPYLAPLGDWLGLPPQPPVWCWFGPAYARLVQRRISGTPVAGGLLYTGGPWVDERLHARLPEVDPARKAAPRMPRGLRRSTLQLLMARSGSAFSNGGSTGGR
ncbi:hypothetical protein [Actinoplanes sp. GCM10030250]|uniref:hypothetical protein n=1 Tax=Actinoplanes sp. GCM10030250 TaxID=3273376 RepID=UPI0036239F26